MDAEHAVAVMVNSSFINSFSEALTQPAGIATFASVGIHGLLWVLLPILPLSSKTAGPEVKQPVQLVELTPQELSRLPEFSTPQLSLPPSNRTNSPTLPSLRSFDFLSPPTAIAPGSPQYSFPLSPPTIDLPSAPPIYEIPDGDLVRPRRNFPTQPPVTNIPDTEDPEEQPGDAPPTYTQIPDLANLPSGAEEQPSEDEADPVPEDTATPTPPETDNSTQANNPPETDDSTQATNNSVPPQQTTNEGRPATIPPEAIARLQAERQRLRELYAYDATGTTETEITAAIEAWSEKTLKPLGKSWKNLTLRPSYPNEACPRKLQGVVAIGVVADAEGKLTAEPTLLQSSGYKLLNQAALAAIQAYEFEPTGETQPYLVSLPFEFSEDACAAPGQQAEG